MIKGKAMHLLKSFISRYSPGATLTLLVVLLLVSACNLDEMLNDKFHPEDSLTTQGKVKSSQTDKTEYYNTFFNKIVDRGHTHFGISTNLSMDNLPKGQGNEVNWTTAVLQGYINPRGSLDPNAEEEPPLDLNIFIEAKVPLMANVLFPHSIHTYWLNCATCHPKIFIPQAGANPITMNEIFDGKWCGRCHGKVAFKFFPIGNCRRCHILLKGESLENEHFR